MKKLFVVVNADDGSALRAFRNESRADDWATDYYVRNGIDTRVDEVWFDEVEEDV